MEKTDEGRVMFKVPRSKVRDFGDFYLIGPFQSSDIVLNIMKACDNPGKAAVMWEEGERKKDDDPEGSRWQAARTARNGRTG